MRPAGIGGSYPLARHRFCLPLDAASVFLDAPAAASSSPSVCAPPPLRAPPDRGHEHTRLHSQACVPTPSSRLHLRSRARLRPPCRAPPLAVHLPSLVPRSVLVPTSLVRDGPGSTAPGVSIGGGGQGDQVAGGAAGAKLAVGAAAEEAGRALPRERRAPLLPRLQDAPGRRLRRATLLRWRRRRRRHHASEHPWRADPGPIEDRWVGGVLLHLRQRDGGADGLLRPLRRHGHLHVQGHAPPLHQLRQRRQQLPRHLPGVLRAGRVPRRRLPGAVLDRRHLHHHVPGGPHRAHRQRQRAGARAHAGGMRQARHAAGRLRARRTLADGVPPDGALRHGVRHRRDPALRLLLRRRPVRRRGSLEARVRRRGGSPAARGLRV